MISKQKQICVLSTEIQHYIPVLFRNGIWPHTALTKTDGTQAWMFTAREHEVLPPQN